MNYKQLHFLLCCILVLSSCTDKIDESNRYTFTGETISDYLENRSETYSSFITILEKATIGKSMAGSVKTLLSTYGSYTCFAPTNEAVDSFLLKQYEIWLDSKQKLENGEIELKDFIETGIHSPNLQDLSDSMASVITKNHLIEASYLTTNLKEGAFPKANMNNRFMILSWVNIDGDDVKIKINNSSYILESDAQVQNGVIQTIDAVLNPSNALLPDLLKSQDEFSIFSEALFLTGLDDSLRRHQNLDYDLGGTYGGGFGNEKCWYPASKYYKNTLLVETNETFSKNNIYNIDDLMAFANRWYGSTYYGSEVNDDYKHRNNPLNRFIAYHIIDRQLQYASGSGPGGFIMENWKGENSSFDSEVNMPTRFDRYDYFESMLPYTSMKATRPFTNINLKNELIINYAQENGASLFNASMKNHINVVVEPVSRVTQGENLSDFNQNALNGIIHVIDRILVYNEDEMVGNVLNERMRWNWSSLAPEWTNNSLRWAQKKPDNIIFTIPDGYCERIKYYSEDSKHFYLPPTGTGLNGWPSWMGDEVMTTGIYDFAYRIPHVPAGTYELRMGFSLSYYRGVVQFYVDGKVTGIPVEMRLTTPNQEIIGWQPDVSDEAINDENDKAMRNRGFMKGFDSCVLDGSSGGTMRDSPLALRKVITMTYLSKGDHWLRFKDVTANNDGNSQFSLNYLEMVPKGVITNISKPEDKH